MELPPAKRLRTDPDQKAALVQRLLAAKEGSGKSFDERLALTLEPCERKGEEGRRKSTLF